MGGRSLAKRKEREGGEKNARQRAVLLASEEGSEDQAVRRVSRLIGCLNEEGETISETT